MALAKRGILLSIMAGTRSLCGVLPERSVSKINSSETAIAVSVPKSALMIASIRSSAVVAPPDVIRLRSGTWPAAWKAGMELRTETPGNSMNRGVKRLGAVSGADLELHAESKLIEETGGTVSVYGFILEDAGTEGFTFGAVGIEGIDIGDGNDLRGDITTIAANI